MFRDCLGIQITQEEMEIVDKICIARPSPNRAIDQIYMKPICMLMQIKLVASYLDNKDIIFMGDGDHMSVMSGVFARPASMTVLDIDPRILESVKWVGQEFDLEIETHQYDVLDSLPDYLTNIFNFFYVNPPYGSKNAGESGIVFISRCIEACKGESSGCIILPYDYERNWTRRTMRNIQRFLLNTGYVIAEKINGLHIYYLDDATLASSTMIVDRIEAINPSIRHKKICLDLY